MCQDASVTRGGVGPLQKEIKIRIMIKITVRRVADSPNSRLLKLRSLSNLRPAQCFHLETWQRAGRDKPNRHAQVEDCLERLLDSPKQRLRVRTIRGKFHFERKLGEGLAAVELNAVLGNFRMGADELLDLARIDVDAAHDNHVVAAPENAAFQGKFVPATGAERAMTRFDKIPGAIAEEG